MFHVIHHQENANNNKIPLHVVRMAQVWNTANAKCWQGQELSLIPSDNTKWQNHFGIQQFLTKLNILLPRDPAITFLGIYPRELKTYVHTKTWTRMSIAVLFITVKTWK